MELTIQHISKAEEANPWFEILERAITKDRRAQEWIYKTHAPRLLAICSRYFENRDDAIEALNHAFLKIFNKISTYNRKNSFEGWTYRIVQLTAIDYVRKQYRKNDYVDVESVQDKVAIDAPVDESYKAEHLLQGLSLLAPTTRVVFNLFAIEGYAHKEIAKLLDISTGTSKWHVSEARRILRKQFKNKRDDA